MNARASTWIYFGLYNLALVPFYAPLFLYTLWRRFVQKKSAASFLGQWGVVPQNVRDALEARDASTPVVWLHAVSVGEVMAARPIARALKRVLPSCRIALSCTTDAGFQTAQGALKNAEVDAAFYFPLDLPLPIHRALNAIAPDVFIAVETELWPNFLDRAHRRRVLCFLANGRVSDNLLKTAPRLKALWRWMFSSLDGLLMRSESDAERMKHLCEISGARDAASKVLTPGDVKLDEISTRAEQSTLRAKWREILKIQDHELFWVCGSTHPAIKENEVAEEVIALRVFQKLKGEFPLRLLLAPRHIERAGEVLNFCDLADVTSIRRSQINDAEEVIVLDTVGELSEIYAAADIAFIGGSLVSRGGHNALEPVLRGVPVFFGLHMNNFRGAAAFIESEKLGETVRDENQLAERLACWLADESLRAQIPDRAQLALAPHQGAATRIAQHIVERLKSKAKSLKGNHELPTT
jgi:3-deoxy-D-manno-octulosonic-acid transferase